MRLILKLAGTNGKSVKYECSGGLVFNKETQTCDFPTRTSCGSRTVRKVQPGLKGIKSKHLFLYFK